MPDASAAVGAVGVVPLLQMTGIVKEFPGVRALAGVDLDVVVGEVHCLLGQNGAGKSTLIKVLAGVHQPDEGKIIWEGEPVTFTTPQAAMNLGIATIYQELDLVDGLTVAENIFLGHEMSRVGLHPARGRANAGAASCSPGSATPRSARPRGRHAVGGRPADRAAWPGRCRTTRG